MLVGLAYPFVVYVGLEQLSPRLFALLLGALWAYGQAWRPDGVESHLNIGLWVAGAVVGGGGLYVVVCQLMGVNELASLIRSMRRKKTAAAP